MKSMNGEILKKDRVHRFGHTFSTSIIIENLNMLSSVIRSSHMMSYEHVHSGQRLLTKISSVIMF